VHLADAEGRIRYHHFGEGEYDEGEWMIQLLLRDAVGKDIGDGLVSVAPDGFEVQADWTNLRSPETYPDDPLNQHGSGGGPMSLREVLVGLIEEYARHMGHVDLLRERIDGRLGQ
jgi:hypothetical protein